MSLFPFLPIPSFTPTPLNKCIVAFIDSGLQNYESLADGLEEGAEAVVIRNDQDGIEQMTSILVTHTCLDSVHILAPGSPGCVELGHAMLSIETLDRYAQDLQVWFFLAQLCDCYPSIHLYGSHVAVGDRGRAFLRRLYRLTGGGILASSTSTGNLMLGGNWNLEQQVGPAYRRHIIRPEVLARYEGLL